MCGDLSGDLAAAATAGVAGSALEYRSVEDYRIDRLNYRLGDIANRLAFLIGVAEVICRVSGAEDIYIAFASVQYHMLIKDRYALEFLRLAAACACFECYFDEEPDVYCVKSAVEAYGIDTDICPRNACVLCTYVAGAVYYVTAAVCKTDAYIFIAVTVTAAVKNAPRFDTAGFSTVASGTAESVFSHFVLPPFVFELRQL